MYEQKTEGNMRGVGGYRSDSLSGQWTMLARAVIESVYQDLERSFRLHEIEGLLNETNRDLFASICGVAKLDEDSTRESIRRGLQKVYVSQGLTNDKLCFTIIDGRPDLKAICKERGLTVTGLARESGVSEKAVRMLMKGRHLCRRKTMAIAEVLGLDWRTLDYD